MTRHKGPINKISDSEDGYHKGAKVKKLRYLSQPVFPLTP